MILCLDMKQMQTGGERFQSRFHADMLIVNKLFDFYYENILALIAKVQC